ncbi:MAG: hypothetical protein WA060_03525 [Minisyncoccia bacterium]
MSLDRKKEKFIPMYSIPLKEGTYLKIRPSANAWWKDQTKTQRLMALFYVGVSAAEARRNIGISKRKYDYFIKIHPEVPEIQKQYKDEIFILATKTVRNRALSDPAWALKYWVKKEPEEFRPPRLLKEIKLMKIELKKDQEEYRDEVRILKRIIGAYREAIDYKKGKYNVNYLKKIDKMIIYYNRQNRGARIERFKELEALEIKRQKPNSEQSGFPGFNN